MIAYALSVLAFSQSGKSALEGTLPEPVSDGVLVHVDLLSMDAVNDTATMRLAMIPTGSYATADQSFATPVRVTLWGVSTGALSYDIRRGDPAAARDVGITMDGDINAYPFDRYSFTHEVEGPMVDPDAPEGMGAYLTATQIGPDGLSVLGPQGEVAVGMLGGTRAPEGAHGWSESWKFSVKDSTLYMGLNMKRGGGVVAFVLVLLVLMIAIGVLAATVASVVAKRWRPIEASFASWFAALLFAMIPLRNFMPGAPPIGAWLDILVFYWVEAALMISLTVFVLSWLYYSRQPVDSDR